VGKGDHSGRDDKKKKKKSKEDKKKDLLKEKGKSAPKPSNGKPAK